jgi:hypothetical protein
MKIRKPQDFLSTGAQIDRSKLSVILPGGKDGPDQLPDSGAIEIRNIAQVQKYAFPSVSEKIAQQFMHGLSFYHCKSSAHVDDRDVADLARASTETQSFLLCGLGQNILSYTRLDS